MNRVRVDPPSRNRNRTGERECPPDSGEVSQTKRWCGVCRFKVNPYRHKDFCGKGRPGAQARPKLLGEKDVLGVKPKSVQAGCARTDEVRNRLTLAAQHRLVRMSWLLTMEDQELTESRLREAQNARTSWGATVRETQQRFYVELELALGAESKSARRAHNRALPKDFVIQGDDSDEEDEEDLPPPGLDDLPVRLVEVIPECAICLDAQSVAVTESGRVWACEPCMDEWKIVSKFEDWFRWGQFDRATTPDTQIAGKAGVAVESDENKEWWGPTSEERDEYHNQLDWFLQSRADIRRRRKQYQQQTRDYRFRLNLEYQRVLQQEFPVWTGARNPKAGECYLHLLNPKVWTEARQLLGLSPLLREVYELATVKEWPLTFYKVRVHESGPGLVHIQKSGQVTPDEVFHAWDAFRAGFGGPCRRIQFYNDGLVRQVETWEPEWTELLDSYQAERRRRKVRREMNEFLEERSEISRLGLRAGMQVSINQFPSGAKSVVDSAVDSESVVEVSKQLDDTIDLSSVLESAPELDQSELDGLLDLLDDLNGVKKKKVPIKVGGKGDCWRKVFGPPKAKIVTPVECEMGADIDAWLNDSTITNVDPTLKEDWDDDTMTMEVFLEQLRQLQERYARRPKRRTNLPPATMWAYLLMVEQEDGDMHVEDVKLYNQIDRTKDYSGWWRTDALPDWDLTKLVGSSAQEIMMESRRINGPDIAKAAATESFLDDLKTTPKTKYRLTSSELNKLERYIGFKVMSQNKVPNTNDHVYLEVAREFLRERLDALFPHNTDSSTALHIGATTTEVKRWFSHLGHDFLFAMKEDKDVARVYEDVNRLVGGKLRELSLPSLTSQKGNATLVKFATMEQAVRLYEKGGRQRIFFGEAERKHDVLFFQDCLYDVSEAEFGKLWESQGAKVGYATMFFPDKMYSDFACDSEIYRYEEYCAPVEDAQWLFDKIWPSIMLLEPLLPLKHIAEFVHKFLIWALKTGWHLFKDWLQRLATDDFPMEACFGVFYNIGKIVPIWNHIMRLLKPLFRFHLCRINITWRNGFSNGYDHRIATWEPWLKKRRFALPSGGFVDAEIAASYGEMKLIKFWRSTGSSPITYSLNIAKERLGVKVMDLEKSLDHLLEIKPVYRTVNQQDWFKLINWALAEPIESIDFNVMMTVLNRIRNGLSLGSDMLVAPMDMLDESVAPIALAAYIEVARRQNVIARIEADDSLKQNWKVNFDDLMERFAKIGLGILTGGLIFPLIAIVKWLMEKHPCLETVIYAEEPEPVKLKGRRVKAADRVENFRASMKSSMDVVLPHKEDNLVMPCVICNVWRQGWFSKDGDKDKGQCFHCTNSHAKNDHDLGFTGAQMVELSQTIRDAETSHTRMGATKLVPKIREFKHWAEANLSGITTRGKVHHLKGGPGTGKSEVIKSLATYFERQGLTVGVLVPFKELQKDYINTHVLNRPGTSTFDVQTTWYGSTWHQKDVMFVDECTGVDWSLIKALAAHCSCKTIYLVGDMKQTCLNSASGEGIDPTNKLSGLDWADVPVHEMQKNYRMDAWRVLLHNQVWGYSMIPVRSDYLPPKCISKREYDAMKQMNQGAEKEMVFAHITAKDAFGVESSADNDEVPNMSVRSAQGKTVEGESAVSAFETDLGVVNAHGMLNVANSRSKGQVYYVYATSLNDPVVVQVRRTLHIYDDSEIEAVKNLPRPVPVEPELTKFILADSEIRLEKLFREKALAGEVQLLHDPEEEDCTWGGLRPAPIVMELKENFHTIEDFDMYNFYSSQFHMCFPEALLKQVDNVTVRSALLKWLGEVYMDDLLMDRGRSGWWEWVSKAKYQKKPLTVTDGKRWLPASEFAAFVDRELGDVIMTDGVACRFVSPARRRQTFRPLYRFLLKKNHVETYTEKKILAYVDDLQEKQSLDEFTITRGKLLLEVSQHKKYKLKLAPDDLKDGVPWVHTGGQDANLAVPSDFAGNMSDIELANYCLEIGPTFEGPVRIDPILPEDAAASDYLSGLGPAFAGNVTLPKQNPIIANSSTVGTASVQVFSEHEVALGELQQVPRHQASNLLATVRNTNRTGVFAGASDFAQLEGLVAGKKSPTIKRVQLPEFSRKHFRIMNEHEPVSSSWKEEEEEPVERLHQKTKLRMGKDAYKLGQFLNNAEASLEKSMLNFAGPVRGVVRRTNASINWEGFIFQRTKAGRVRPFKMKEYYSLAVGMGNHYNKSPVESLVAAQRIGRRQQKPAFSAEAVAFARQLAKSFYDDCWRPVYVRNREKLNARIELAYKHAKQRNYHGRADAEVAAGKDNVLVVSNKDQFKPIKGGKLDLGKNGQVLVQSPARVNLEFMAWMRIQGYLFKKNMTPEIFTDDYESAQGFRKRLSRAVRALPDSVLVGIADGEQWDSQQNSVTLEIEKELCRLFGATDYTIERYFRVRGNLDYIMYGVFKGRMNGEKGSGFLDTKLGNTKLQGALSHAIFVGVGPRVEAIKGDDYLRTQSGLTVDDRMVTKIKALTGMSLKVEIGRGGEFCGNSVSRIGVFPSVVRAAQKALAAKAVSYQQFTAQQQSYRDLIKEYLACGLEEVIHYSAYAEGISASFAEMAVAFINSMGHINESQWKSVVRKRVNPRFHLNGAEGPCII